MKSKLFSLLSLALFFASTEINAQTAGTLTVNYTQPTPTSPTGSKNAYAVWIQNSTGAFVKTRARYAGAGMGTNDHLPDWAAKAGCTASADAGGFLDALSPSCKIVDALTGATRSSTTTPTAFGAKSFTWDAKDNNGVLVADGTYTVLIESAWNGGTADGTHNTVYSFTFNKTSTASTTNPAASTYFTGITATWAPSTLGVNDVNAAKKVFAIYPNPTTNNFSVKTSENVKTITLYDATGKQIKSFEKADSYDISSLKAGVYFIDVKTVDGNSAMEKIIKK